MHSIRIRPAADNDFPMILSIWKQGVPNSFDETRLNDEKVLDKFRMNFFQRDKTYDFWVAVDPAGNIVGWQSLIRIFNNPFREEKAAESSTYISGNHHFRGIGRLLLTHMQECAASNGLHYIFGFVTTQNNAALKLTAELGWQTVGPIPLLNSGNDKFEKLLLVKVLG